MFVFRYLLLWLFIVAIATRFSSPAIIPFSVQETNLLFDDQPSTQQVITFVCSETNQQGALTVGNYDVSITCVPPVIQADLTEIARVPQSLDLHSTDISCLATDPDRFLQAFRDAANDFIATGNRRRLLSFEQAFGINHRRGLKQIDPLSLALSTAALVIGLRAEAKADAANQKVDALTGVVKDTNIALSNLTSVVGLHDQAIKAQEKMIANLTQGLQETNQAVSHALNIQNNTINTLQLLTASVQNQLVSLQDNIQSTQAQTSAFINSQNNQTHQMILALASSMYSIVATIKDELKEIRVEHEIAIQNINARDAAREDIESDRILMNSVTKGVHESLARLDDTMKALLKNSGIAPTPLSGIDAVNLQEYMNLGFVTPTVGSIYEIHNVKMSYFLDTEFGLKQQVEGGTQVLSLPTMLTYFTTSNCKRAYVLPTDTPDADSDIPCQFYVEVDENYCQTTLSPAFDWQTLVNQTLDIQPSWCVGAGSIQPVTKVVLRTFEQYMNYVNTNLCPKRRPGTNFQVHLARGKAIGYFNTTIDCNIEWDAVLRNLALNKNAQPSLLFVLLSTVQRVWGIANVDLSKKRIKRFGLLPGGIDIEVLPRFSIPTAVNATTGVPIYDGAAEPSHCLRAHWVSAHQSTVSIYSAMLANNPAVDKNVIVNVQPKSGYVCDDPAVCYPVGTSVVKQNIIYTSDRLPDLNPRVFAGSLIPEIVKQQGMFDIPETQLECNPNARANENTACYFNMPPGTTETWDLPTWIANNGDIFEPRKATISLADSRFEAVFDKDGFPMCGFLGAYHPWAIDNSTAVDIHGCNLPFMWRNSSIPTVFNSSPTLIYPTECLQPSTTVIFKQFGDTAHLALYGTSALAQVQNTNIMFSFWFQSLVATDTASDATIIAIRGISTAAGTKYLKIIVDALGRPAVVISTNLGSGGTITLDTRTITNAKRILTTNLRDGVLHQIIFKQTVASYNTGSGVVTYSLYVDNIFQGDQTSTTGSYLRSDANPIYMNPGAPAADNDDFATLGMITPTVSKTWTQYACQQGWMNKHCSQASTKANVMIARMNVTHTNNIDCLTSSKLVLSTSDFDLAHPAGVVDSSELFGTTSWSIGFWIRLPTTGLVTGQYVLLRNALTSVKVALNSVSGLLDLYVNTILVGSMNVQDLDAHAIHISYNGAQAFVYLDGKLFTAATTVTINTGGSGSIKNITSDLNYISMLKFYPSVALTAGEINDEMRCQIEIKLPTTSFVPPIGYCEVSATDPLHGYCRSPLMCAGHCSAYATIDNTTRTFTIGDVNCDDGYKEPSCTSQCYRIDDATGRCVDLANKFSAALTPLGYICNLARDYQLEMDLPNKRLHQTPRQWLYLVTVQVPTGVVTSILGSAQCPKVDLIDLGTGELIVTFENPGDVESNIAVKYAPDTYVADPNNVECDSICCNFNTAGTLYSIPAHLTYSLLVPTCGNMTIQVSKLSIVNSANQYTLCTTLSGESLAAAVRTTTLRQNANALSGVKLLVDTASDHLYDIQQKIAAATFDALLVRAINSNATDAELTVLFQLKNTVLESSLLTFNTTFNPINLTGIIQGNLDKMRSELVIAATNLAQSNQLIVNIPLLQALVDAMLANSSQVLDSVQKTILGNLAAITIIEAIKPGGGSFGDIGIAIRDGIEGIATGVADLALDAVHGGISLADKAMDAMGLGGGGGLFGNFFSGIFKLLLQLLLPVLIVVGIYFAWKYRKTISKLLGCDKKTPPTNETAEIHQPQAIHSPEARVNVHNSNSSAEGENASLLDKSQQPTTSGNVRSRLKFFRTQS